nr:MAG TPA: hypothetical protein [Caudoviricetes sp.]
MFFSSYRLTQTKKRPARCWSTERGKVGTTGSVFLC